MLFLTAPAIQYKDTFLQGLREIQREGRWLQYNPQRARADFPYFVQQMLDQQDRMKISPDRMPSTTFWLIDGEEFIGTLTLSYELNDFLFRIGGHIGYLIRPSKRKQGYGKKLLHLGLQKARARGLQRVLITCDENNIASKKVIESNGGQFENCVAVEGSDIKKLRYWINL